jgi:GDPmannose 4,6-dehydratase
LNRVLITGGKGQDGTLLRELLESQGVEVFSFGRPHTVKKTISIFPKRGENTSDRNVDLIDFEACLETTGEINPDTIFHLAAVHAPSHIMNSIEWEANKELTYNTHVKITQNLINSLKEMNSSAQLIVAGSSRMYTPVNATLLVDELTPTNPSDYYGFTKAETWEVLRKERERTGLTLKMAILFNHESKLRKNGFLFKDLAHQINLFESGSQDYIEVKDAMFRGDWHSAVNTAEGFHLMATEKGITDLVLASGKLVSVQEIVDNYFDDYPSKKKPRIISNQSGSREGEKFSIVGNISIAESFGWKPDISLTTALREIVESEG